MPKVIFCKCTKPLDEEKDFYARHKENGKDVFVCRTCNKKWKDYESRVKSVYAKHNKAAREEVISLEKEVFGDKPVFVPGEHFMGNEAYALELGKEQDAKEKRSKLQAESMDKKITQTKEIYKRNAEEAAKKEALQGNKADTPQAQTGRAQADIMQPPVTGGEDMVEMGGPLEDSIADQEEQGA